MLVSGERVPRVLSSSVSGRLFPREELELGPVAELDAGLLELSELEPGLFELPELEDAIVGIGSPTCSSSNRTFLPVDTTAGASSVVVRLLCVAPLEVSVVIGVEGVIGGSSAGDVSLDVRRLACVGGVGEGVLMGFPCEPGEAVLVRRWFLVLSLSCPGPPPET